MAINVSVQQLLEKIGSLTVQVDVLQAENERLHAEVDAYRNGRKDDLDPSPLAAHEEDA